MVTDCSHSGMNYLGTYWALVIRVTPLVTRDDLLLLSRRYFIWNPVHNILNHSTPQIGRVVLKFVLNPLYNLLWSIHHSNILNHSTPQIGLKGLNVLSPLYILPRVGLKLFYFTQLKEKSLKVPPSSSEWK